VCALNTANISAVHSIRSYRKRGAQPPSCTILQAACACIASPNTFDPVAIGGGHRKAVLTDAMTICANPAKELLREAQVAFGKDAEVATIVSVGTGKGNVKAGGGMSEQVHEDMKNRLRSTAIYYRFNVHQEMEIQSETVFACVSAYMRETATSTRLDSAVDSIHQRLTGVKLKDIGKHEYALYSGTHHL
jgi:hypothetical protein